MTPGLGHGALPNAWLGDLLTLTWKRGVNPRSHFGGMKNDIQNTSHALLCMGSIHTGPSTVSSCKDSMQASPNAAPSPFFIG